MALISDTPDMITFRCDGARDGKHCGAEHTGKPHELAELGWVAHPYACPGMRRKSADFLLCDVCSKHFEAIWKARAA